MPFELVETHHLNTERAAHATKTTATKMKEFNSKEREKKHELAREKCAHKYICNDKTIRWKYNAKPLYLNNFRVHFSPVGLFSAIYFVIVAF